MEDNIIGTIYRDDGESVSVSLDQVSDAMTNFRDDIDHVFEESYSIEDPGDSFFTIDIKPPIGEELYIVIKNTGSVGRLKPGKYGVLNEAYENSEDNSIEGGLLLMYSPDCLIDGSFEAIPTTVFFDDENGERTEDEREWWALRDSKSGKFINLSHITEALTVLASLKFISEKLGIVVDVDDNREPGSYPIIKTEEIDKADFPLDKVNSNIWKLIEGARDRQFGFDFAEDDGLEVFYDEETGLVDARLDVRRGRTEKPVYLTYCVDFSELEGSITKKLEPYDKRVCIALGALYNAGHEYVSLQQIYEAMGNTGQTGKADRDKINVSLTKLSGAKLHLDNYDEVSKHSKRMEFSYDGAVAPIERVTAVSNGQIVESAIHIFREPPPISFAKSRGQFTTITVNLLNSPLSKTGANITLEDYLLERISRMKNSGGDSGTSNKMLYETIYQRTGIRTSKQKQRAPEKIKKALDHYKACGWIDSYKASKEGIEIFF